jgi:hypothetical protein
MAADDPGRWVTIASDAPPDAVTADVVRAVAAIHLRSGVHGA